MLYDCIGTGYNSTRKADSYLISRILHLLQPEDDKLYLDIGCGTGNYTVALAEKGLRFVGVEPSEKMLSQARVWQQKVTWLKGAAEQIPAESNTFAGAIATLTIHHWKDLRHSMIEINRVLTANGRLVFFTSTREQMEGYWLNHYFPNMLLDSMKQMPSFDTIINTLTYAGFEITAIEKYFVRDDLQDHFLYVGKNKPECYFNDAIRSGISSFSAVANAEEVETGLKALQKDMENKAFDSIKRKYDSDLGDYMFIVAEKINTYSTKSLT